MAPPLLTVVADAGPLISLGKIELLPVLEPLFPELMIPSAVALEITSVRLPAWITQRNLINPIDDRLLTTSLNPGETEAIALALELETYDVLIDERAGRRRALDLGLRVTGTFGLLLTPKQHGIVHRVFPILQQLMATGFFASPDLIAEVAALAGESSDEIY